MKILYADDSSIMRELTSLYLEQLGHTVKTVADGDEILECIKSAPFPDVIVTDNNMERVSGVEVLRRLRADDRLKNLKVIVYSADMDAKLAVEGLGGKFAYKTSNNLSNALEIVEAEITKEKR